MNMPAPNPPLFSEREQCLIEAIRLLEQILPGAFDQVEGHVWALVQKHLKWDWSDKASLDRAMRFAVLDPEIRRESKEISEEFECTLGDGLEGY